MRFKKGDKVWMVGKDRRGISVPSMRGTVIGINNRYYDPPKMMVELENGDRVIQDITENGDCIAAFKPNYILVDLVNVAVGLLMAAQLIGAIANLT